MISTWEAEWNGQTKFDHCAVISFQFCKRIFPLNNVFFTGFSYLRGVIFTNKRAI